MTGYGNGKSIAAGKCITAEIKSVNSRYFDISYRTPKAYSRLEDKIKTAVNAYTTRGKIEVFISYELLPDSAEAFISVNHDYVKNYLHCLKELCDTYKLTDDISVMRLSQNKDVFTSVKSDEDADVLWSGLEGALCEALTNFYAMKKTEGGKMYDDITEKLSTIEGIIEKIALLSPKTLKSYEDRLKARIEEYTSGFSASACAIDEGRILTEIAIFADKIAIDEEIVRLRSHIKQFYSICVRDDNTPVGRKLDFLLQEINREINTIGSKANDAEIASLVVEAKSEAEKIREQVQNIE